MTILNTITLDPRIKYDHELGSNDESVLFICLTETGHSTAAFLQFRSFNDSMPDQLFFVCKENKIKGCLTFMLFIIYFNN